MSGQQYNFFAKMVSSHCNDTSVIFLQVFLAKGNVPAESYNVFIDILLLTIRDEIAACAEKAYEKIAFQEASRMLFFTSLGDMKEYGEKVRTTSNNHTLCEM